MSADGKKLNSSRGEERAAEGLNSSRRTGGGFGVAQIAGGREGEREREREREREGGREREREGGRERGR